MIVKECKKISKIVDELFLYFLKHGYSSINVDVNVSDLEIVICIKTDLVEEVLLEKLTERINRKRELEVEEYGWELMGESDCSNELEMIGLLIDTFTYINENNKSELTFIRKRK